MKKLIAFVSVCCCMGNIEVSGQNNNSNAVMPAIMQSQYLLMNPNRASLYNGPVYTQYFADIIYEDKYPYLDEWRWKNGCVVYDGQAFENIEMKYDIVLDELIAIYKDDKTIIRLVKSKVSSFQFRDRLFVNMPAGNGLSGGYYEEIYSGRTKVLVKYRKTYKPGIIDQDEVIHKIEDEPTVYYVFWKGQYRPVHNERTLYRMLDGHRKEVKAFVKVNALDVKENLKLSLPTIAKYCDNDLKESR
ncbi:hypothetical protein [Chitinophaga skermanii]|nr:hypothetical protein [Chitinophaga skermanii]